MSATASDAEPTLNREEPTYPAAVASDLVLYHVVHPTDANADQWTQHYQLALATCAQFVRGYGGVHLHAEVHQAGQYEARCLLRTETTNRMVVELGRKQL